jgi:hypothetical protein
MAGEGICRHVTSLHPDLHYKPVVPFPLARATAEFRGPGSTRADKTGTNLAAIMLPLAR